MRHRGRLALSVALGIAMVLGMCPMRGVAETIDVEPDEDEVVVEVESEEQETTDGSDDSAQAEAQEAEVQTTGEQAQYVAEVQNANGTVVRYPSISNAISDWKTTGDIASLVLLNDCSESALQVDSLGIKYRSLDLNGHTLKLPNRTLHVGSGTTFVLEDNAGGSGKLSTHTIEVDGHFIMKDTTITDNGGAGVSPNEHSTALQITVTLSGGCITGCTGGGIHLNYKSTLNVSGAPIIAGNTKNDQASNVYLPKANPNISGNNEIVKLTVTGPLTDGASIGVTTETEPTADNPVVFTKDYGAYNPNDDPARFFTSDNPDFCVAWNEDRTEAALVVHQHKWNYAASGNTLTATCANKGCPANGGNKQTLTLYVQDKTYDGKPAAATVQTSAGWASTGAKAGDVTYYQGNTQLGSAPIDAGDYEARVVVQTASGQQTIRASFTIRQTPLTITANDNTICVGGAPTDAGVTYAGFITGEGTSALSGSLAYDYGGYVAGAAAGTYPITPSGLTATNYAITYRAGTLTVLPDDLPDSVPVTAIAHVQRKGTLPASTGVGKVVGTTGKSKRLESLRLSLAEQPLSGGIEYRAHVQRAGWQGWKSDSELAGTEGRSRRLEAVQIRLTGAIANYYDVYYRVHVQKYGWMAWAKNGAKAGTTGMSRRAEAVQVVIVRKGAPAPGRDYNGATQTYGKPFVKR